MNATHYFLSAFGFEDGEAKAPSTSPPSAQLKLSNKVDALQRADSHLAQSLKNTLADAPGVDLYGLCLAFFLITNASIFGAAGGFFLAEGQPIPWRLGPGFSTFL